MKFIFYFIFVAICLGLNFGFFSMLNLLGSVPNLSLLLVIIVALFEDGDDFLFFAVLCGLILDFWYGVFPGSFSLGFMLLGTIVKLIAKNILAIHMKPVYLPVFLFFGLAVVYIWIWFFGNIVESFHFWVYPIHLDYLFRKFIPNFLYNLILLYPLYALWLILQDLLITFSSRRQTIK